MLAIHVIFLVTCITSIFTATAYPHPSQSLHARNEYSDTLDIRAFPDDSQALTIRSYPTDLEVLEGRDLPRMCFTKEDVTHFIVTVYNITEKIRGNVHVACAASFFSAVANCDTARKNHWKVGTDREKCFLAIVEKIINLHKTCPEAWGQIWGFLKDPPLISMYEVIKGTGGKLRDGVCYLLGRPSVSSNDPESGTVRITIDDSETRNNEGHRPDSGHSGPPQIIHHIPGHYLDVFGSSPPSTPFGGSMDPDSALAPSLGSDGAQSSGTETPNNSGSTKHRKPRAKKKQGKPTLVGTQGPLIRDENPFAVLAESRPSSRASSRASSRSKYSQPSFAGVTGERSATPSPSQENSRSSSPNFNSDFLAPPPSGRLLTPLVKVDRPRHGNPFSNS